MRLKFTRHENHPIVTQSLGGTARIKEMLMYALGAASAHTGSSRREGSWGGRKEQRAAEGCWGQHGPKAAWLSQLGPRAPGDKERSAGIWSLPSESAIRYAGSA